MSVTRPALRQPSLLIVEDLPDQQALINHVLSEILPEFTTIWVADAPSALTYLVECDNGNHPLPRLTLLDLYLPGREQGWSLLRQLKTRSILNRMPVVILSRSDHKEDIERCYELGVSSYITKPDTLEEWKAYFRVLRHYWFQIVKCPPSASGRG